MGDVPEQVFIDAARASVLAQFPGRPAFAATVRVDVDEPDFRAAVASAYRAGQAATPDGPRTWALPDEPGPEVTAVLDEGGRLWRRHAGLWCYVNPYLGHSHRAWAIVVFDHGPLTDATTADGRDCAPEEAKE